MEDAPAAAIARATAHTRARQQAWVEWTQTTATVAAAGVLVTVGVLDALTA